MLPRVTRWSLLQRAEPAGLADAAVRAARAGGSWRPRRSSTGRWRAPGSPGCGRAATARDQILLGETAPIGRVTGPLARRPISPVEFLRKLFCLTPGGAAARRRAAAGGSSASRSPASPTTPTSAAARGRRPSRPRRRARSRSRRRRGCGACSTGGAGAPDPAPAAGLLHRVRLPDQPARPHLRRARWHSSPPTSTSPTGWRTATGGCAAVGAVQARRRRAAAELPVRAALRRRAAEAGLRRLPAADLGQRARRAAAGLRAGAPGRRTERRRPCGSRCGRRTGGAFATVKTVTVRSRRGQFLVRVPRRPGVWRLVWGSLVSREARVAPR